MKFRTRQLPNGKWAVEVKRWHDINWKGAYVDRMTTGGSLQSGARSVPVMSVEAPGSIHYPLTWHANEAHAQAEVNELMSIAGITTACPTGRKD
jgi:hypothetical protein